MCGIFCVICESEEKCDEFFTRHAEKLILNRGPNSHDSCYHGSIKFYGSVLWQQGKVLQTQPVVSDKTVLLFNGDLYMKEIIEESDTKFLFELIEAANDESDFLAIFTNLQGPYSIICQFQSQLFVARDALGRNSLLIGKCENTLFFGSVVDPDGEQIEAIELPPLGVYKINLENYSVELIPYQDVNLHEYNVNQLDLLTKIIPVRVIENVILPPWLKTSNKNIYKYRFDKLKIDLDNIFESLLENPEVEEACDSFIKLLSHSVKDRVQKTQNFCKNCDLSSSCQHSRIAILFSGGVDCSLLTLLADKFIDKNSTIDLLNVSFEKISYAAKKTKCDWNVPDRLTGLQTYEELKTLCPHRLWNFVEINVTREEMQKNARRLSSLIFPLCNILDESLGIAINYASRGEGLLNGESYKSPCRVILIGQGADELFGGYSRHRTAFRRSTEDCDLLQRELDFDWVRLPSRNLARDDRVVADNEITARAPFIEENFVNFARSLHPLQRCYPALAEGIGDKLLLRLCAYKLALKNCSRFKKRALQFGCRIADKRQCANDPSQLLLRQEKDAPS